MTVAELRKAHYDTALVKVARHITGHDRVSLICDEKRVYVKEVGKDGFSVEWADYTFSDGTLRGTNYKGTAEAILKGLAN